MNHNIIAFEDASILSTHQPREKRELIEQLHIKCVSDVVNKKSVPRSASSICVRILDCSKKHSNVQEGGAKNATLQTTQHEREHDLQLIACFVHQN